MLPWGIGPRLQAPSEWSYMDPVPDYTPLDKGGLTPAMGTTGLRDEVGPIVHRQARYIIERSADMRRAAVDIGMVEAVQAALHAALDKPQQGLGRGQLGIVEQAHHAQQQGLPHCLGHRLSSSCRASLLHC